MSEANKIKRNNYNSDVVKRVAKKIGVTTRFVTQSLNGDRTSETADKICKEYKRITKKVESFLENQ